jgi:hypothetical protein
MQDVITAANDANAFSKSVHFDCTYIVIIHFSSMITNSNLVDNCRYARIEWEVLSFHVRGKGVGFRELLETLALYKIGSKVHNQSISFLTTCI